MISDLSRRVREATWFLGAIAATIGAGSFLYLISVPLSFVWGLIASALGGFFFCLWLFRSEIFWHLYHTEELEWAESTEAVATEEPPTYLHAGDTIVRFMRQPTLNTPVPCGVKVLDGSDSLPLEMTGFDSAVEQAYRTWVRLGREYTVDVKICDRTEALR